jgi:hypothetical protein
MNSTWSELLKLDKEWSAAIVKNDADAVEPFMSDDWVSVGTFIKGDDRVFQLTHQGWERRHEFLRRLPRFSASAILARRAFEAIQSSVSLRVAS